MIIIFDLLLSLYNISITCTDIYVDNYHGGQHDSGLLGFSAGLHRAVITYTDYTEFTVFYVHN